MASSEPALKQAALAEVSRHLLRPQLLLDSPLLDGRHPWRRDALIVSDAFEAVTNGMEDGALLEALALVGADSPLAPWCPLIRALQAFYDHRDEDLVDWLDQVPAGGPAADLAQALLNLSGAPAAARTSRYQALADEVTPGDPAPRLWAQDVSEALDSGDENLFWQAFGAWLDAAAAASPERARAAVRWVWTQLEWRDFDEEELLVRSAGLWGRAEAYRLAALGSWRWDRDGAALLWLRFLIEGVREGRLDQGRATEGLTWLDRFDALPAPDDERRPLRVHLVRSWNDEVRLRGWSGLALNPPTATTEPAPARAAATGQLELFAS